MARPKNFQKGLETGFSGWMREDYTKAAEAFGVDVSPSDSDEVIKQRILIATGNADRPMLDNTEQASAAPLRAVTAGRQRVPLGKAPPNGLDGKSLWAGRKQRVTLAQTEHNIEKPQRFIWESLSVDLLGGVQYDIPWPHYQILTNAVADVPVKDKNGDITHNCAWRKVPQHPFSNHGPTPGTEHLPKSGLEWFQWMAEDNDHLKRANAFQLVAILQVLNDGQIKREDVKGVPADELRAKVLEFLGMQHVLEAEWAAQEAAA